MNLLVITGRIHVLDFSLKWTYIGMERKCREKALGQNTTSLCRTQSRGFN